MSMLIQYCFSHIIYNTWVPRPAGLIVRTVRVTFCVGLSKFRICKFRIADRIRKLHGVVVFLGDLLPSKPSSATVTRRWFPANHLEVQLTGSPFTPARAPSIHQDLQFFMASIGQHGPIWYGMIPLEELSEGGYELATNLHVHPVKWVLLMAEALCNKKKPGKLQV